MSEQGGQYDIGEPVELTATFDRAPTDVTVEVMKPDGTMVTPAPTVETLLAPTYTAVVVPDVPDTWTYRFIGTGDYSGVEEGYFTVLPSAVEAGKPAYTYNLDTAIGYLRLLIDDRDLSRVGRNVPLEQRSAVFSDAELQKFLTHNAESAHLGAAEALIVLANNRSLLVQSRRISETTVDYGNVRADLLKQAAEMRNIGNQTAGTTPADGIAEVAYTDFNARQIMNNSFLREPR